MSDWIQSADGNETIREDTEAVMGRLRAEIERLRAALKIAAQWVPLPHQAHTPDARRDAEIVQAALSTPQQFTPCKGCKDSECRVQNRCVYPAASAHTPRVDGAAS